MKKIISFFTLIFLLFSNFSFVNADKIINITNPDFVVIFEE